MGKHTDNLRAMYAHRPRKKTVHELGHDAYFIRLKSTRNFWQRLSDTFLSYFLVKEREDVYIHYEGERNAEEQEYRPKKGLIGAAIWKLDQAKEFIKLCNARNLELVQIDKVIKK
ncbi:MAG: hypothetical protein AAB638_00670 [Patescibacteria group bacterium]